MFAFLAIVTSFLAVALSLIDFLADGLHLPAHKKRNRFFLLLLTLLPPLFFGIRNPHLFLKGLQLAGGIGAMILYGVLPVWMVWRGRYHLGKKGTRTSSYRQRGTSCHPDPIGWNHCFDNGSRTWSTMNSRIIGVTLLVAGTTIGAGMLALPLVTGPSGYLPAVFLLITYWAFMLYTAFLLLETTLSFPSGANLVTMARDRLGITGQAITWIVYLFLRPRWPTFRVLLPFS